MLDEIVEVTSISSIFLFNGILIQPNNVKYDNFSDL